MATARLPHTGSTAPGFATSRLAITIAKTAFTRSNRKKITKRNSTRARPPTMDSVSVPIDCAL